MVRAANVTQQRELLSAGITPVVGNLRLVAVVDNGKLNLVVLSSLRVASAIAKPTPQTRSDSASTALSRLVA